MTIVSRIAVSVIWLPFVVTAVATIFRASNIF